MVSSIIAGTLVLGAFVALVTHLLLGWRLVKVLPGGSLLCGILVGGSIGLDTTSLILGGVFGALGWLVYCLLWFHVSSLGR